MNKLFLRVLTFFFLAFMSIEYSYGQVDEQLVSVADEMYNFGDVKDALEVFLQAIEMNPNNKRGNFMAGKCYLESIHKEKSLPYLLKAYELDPEIAPNILFLIGTSYHLGNNFDQAISYYNQFKQKVESQTINETFTEQAKADEIKKIDRRIEECGNAKYYIANPVSISLESIGKVVNSEYGDYAPVLSADESVMYFTSRRAGSTGGNKDNDNEFFEDIYMSNYANGQWTTPQNMGPVVNTDLHEATVGLSPDGKQLFIYVDNDANPGDIFYTTLKNNVWAKPKPLPGSINTPYIEESASITASGKVLFFSSNKPDGKGGMDIYMVKMQKDGEWGTPINLGDINTPYDEKGPFIDIDGKTLYFTSKGHKGMGGFDIYKSVYDSTAKKWSAPESLGYPVNSTDDDIYYVLGGKTRTGYFASVKSDGLGDLDIYKILTTEPPKDTTIAAVKDSTIKTPLVKTDSTSKGPFPVTLTVNIIDDLNQPLDATIEIRELKTNKIVFVGQSKDAKILHSFKNTVVTKYIITGEHQGYIFKSARVTIPAMSDKPVNINATVQLDDVKDGMTLILRNVYYDFDKATLQQESYPELDKVVKFLKDNPTVKVEISSHTDDVGSDEYNLVLSQKRAQSAVNYLVSKGIAKTRLVPKGYGETRPIASNDDENDGRELNRRTEFKILSH